ncbi:MAG: hypothetical protein WBG50_15830 [Desulfomonilaceae bacterium]
MKTRFRFVAIMMIPALLVCVSAFARDPIKWSAPMNQYPNAWSPTTPPPSYGYQYPYANYGYGNPYAYYGYGGNYGGYYQGNYQQPQQRGYTGNPYTYYDGQ